MRRISVIGAGRIGSCVIAGLPALGSYRLARVLTRSGKPDTADAKDFMATPCDIVIETAGPQALVEYAGAILERADLWTVSAAILANDDLRGELESIASRNGRTIRLFSDWIAAADHAFTEDATMHVVAKRPGIGEREGILYRGGLREAAAKYPDHLNSAVAAALCGPGLDRTTVELVDTGPGGEHGIVATVDTGTSRFSTTIELAEKSDRGAHPTASAILAALRRDGAVLRYG